MLRRTTRRDRLIGLFMLAVIAVMWRRANVAAREQARYAEEFQNQQRVLDTYAQQNPADIARDLEDLFGMPPVQERNVG